MLTGKSSLLQVHQLYLREIKTKEHLYWRRLVIKTHNMSIANRKSHNYAVQLLVKATNIPYSVELAKLMNLIINEKFTQRKMYLLILRYCKQFNDLNKMRKYNIWNKIFHKRELNKNVADYKLQQGLVNSYECWLIGNANTLAEYSIMA